MSLQCLVDLSGKLADHQPLDFGAVVGDALAESSHSRVSRERAGAAIGSRERCRCNARSGADASEDLVTSGGHRLFSRHQSRKVCGAGALRSRVRVHPRKTAGSRLITPFRLKAREVAIASRSARANRRRLAMMRAAKRMTNASRRSPARFDRATAQVEENGWDVDLDGANLVARAAETRRKRQRLGVLDADELRGEDRADRAWVHRPVGVTAGAGVHRADVQAGTAADAMERLASNTQTLAQ